MLMSQVHAVKVSDRGNGSPEIIGYFVNTVENIHDYSSIIPFISQIAGANIALLSFISSSFLMTSQKTGQPAGFDGIVKTMAWREHAVIFA
jgi:hypothetical protein